MSAGLLKGDDRLIAVHRGTEHQAIVLDDGRIKTSSEVVADLINREVECRFEGACIAFGLGKQQAAL
jgi:hypothetical protein